jgi:hypothetical protein
LLGGRLPPVCDWPRRGGRLPLCAIAACSPRWYRDWRGERCLRARMLLPTVTGRRSGGADALTGPTVRDSGMLGR